MFCFIDAKTNDSAIFIVLSFCQALTDWYFIQSKISNKSIQECLKESSSDRLSRHLRTDHMHVTHVKFLRGEVVIQTVGANRYI